MSALFSAREAPLIVLFEGLKSQMDTPTFPDFFVLIVLFEGLKCKHRFRAVGGNSMLIVLFEGLKCLVHPNVATWIFKVNRAF